MELKSYAAVLIALFLAACNPMAQLDGAEEKIERFHQVYNDGDARALYGLTSEEFRAATTPQQMDALVARVNDQMGTVKSTERIGFNINSDNGATVSTLTMTTTFEKGEGTETYTFLGTGEEMRLVAWHVDSPNFMEVPTEAVTVVDADGEAEAEAPAAE